MECLLYPLKIDLDMWYIQWCMEKLFVASQVMTIVELH